MFFNKFPSAEYDFLNRRTGYNEYQQVPDLFKQVRPDKLNLDASMSYYKVKVGQDRPDQLSTKLYGSPKYYWTFFMLNDNLSLANNSWHMTQETFENYMAYKYNYYNVRLWREEDLANPANSEGLGCNSIDDRLPIGAKLIGGESLAVATIINRHFYTNSLDFTYDGVDQFIEGETLFMVDQSYYYVNDEFDYVSWDHTLDVIKDTCSRDEDVIGVYVNVEGFIDYIKRNYDIREGQNAIHHWQNSDDGIWHNNYLHIEKPGALDVNITDVTNREYEEALNDEMGIIKAVRPELIVDFSQQVKSLLHGRR